jgi:hypothetical protein
VQQHNSLPQVVIPLSLCDKNALNIWQLPFVWRFGSLLYVLGFSVWFPCFYSQLVHNIYEAFLYFLSSIILGINFYHLSIPFLYICTIHAVCSSLCYSFTILFHSRVWNFWISCLNSDTVVATRGKVVRI